MGHRLTVDRTAPSRRWLAFTSGVIVGVAISLVGIGVVVAAERARRGAAGRKGPGTDRAPVVYPPTGEAKLDEELAQTFPASDPLPYPHRID